MNVISLQTEQMEIRMIEGTAKSCVSEDKLKKQVAILKTEITKMEKARTNEVVSAQQKIVSVQFWWSSFYIF